MIVGVGTDVIAIDRMKKICSKKRYLERMFHKDEISLVADHPTKAAGNFAVKEAVSKVFGTGFSGFEAYEIAVLREENGRPYIKLYGRAKEKARELGIDVLHVSISNTESLAIAYVIGERL